MKRLSFLLLITILLFSLVALSPVTALAEDISYLEIDRDGVCLYRNEYQPAPLFVIPKTFYVKIIDAHRYPDYAIVEYNGVEGLVKLGDTSGKTLINVENPYYTARNISAHINSYLYTSPSFEAQSTIKAYGLTLTYLGKVQGEKGTYGTSTWFAVLYTNQVYFIHSAMTENLDLLEETFAPVHPNSIVTNASTGETVSEDDGDTAPASSFDTVRLLLIIGMIVPIVIILFLLFRPRRKRGRVRGSRHDRYSDEEEYDDY